MKLKNILIRLCISICIVNSLCAMEMADKANSINWNFEFSNKSGKKIEITIKSGGRLIISKVLDTMLDRRKLRINIDPTSSYLISIREIGPRGFYEQGGFYKDYYVSKNLMRNQLFLTFDTNKILRPQKGTWSGVGTALGFGKTESGLKIKDNLKANEIKVVNVMR